MNAFSIAALAQLLLLVPTALVALWRRPIDGLVALELAGGIVVLMLICFAEGFHRGTYFTVAVIAAVCSWLGGLIYARVLGRWL